MTEMVNLGMETDKWIGRVRLYVTLQAFYGLGMGCAINGMYYRTNLKIK